MLCTCCNQNSYTFLDALPVSDPKCQDDCITFAKKTFHDPMMNIGFVSEMNNMYSVESKGLKYRGCDEYAVAAVAVMVHDHNIQELLPDKLQYTIIDTLEYRYSTEETVDFSAYCDDNILTDKPHYIIVETPEHKNFTRYMLSEKIPFSDDTDDQFNTGLTWVQRWTNFNFNPRIVFETKNPILCFFSFPDSWYGRKAKHSTDKQKQICENSKHAHRSQQ